MLIKNKKPLIKDNILPVLAFSSFVIFASLLIVCVKFNHIGKAYAADFAVHGKTLLVDEDDGGGNAECAGDAADGADTCDGGDAEEGGDNADDGGDDADAEDGGDDAEEGCDVEAQADNEDAMNTTAASHVLGANITTIHGHITRNKQTGLFSNPSFDVSSLLPGRYKMVLHVNGYLKRQLIAANGASIRIGAGQKTIAINPTTLIAGDIAPLPNGNNLIDIEDYNVVYACLGMKASAAPTQTCLDPRKADIDKNGMVNEADLTIIQQNFAKSGAALNNPATLVTPVNRYSCFDDPTCDKNTKTLQLCPLKCELLD